MATDFTTFQNLVKVGLGNRDDADTLAVIKAAINFAALMAALIFDPPELRKKDNLTVIGGNDNVSLSGLANWLEVDFIYNQTDSWPMGFIPLELLEYIIPANLVNTKYYSIHGDTVYVRAKPTANKILNVYHRVYPADLVESDDALDFDHHDSYIVAVAHGLSWAAFEESEAAQMWNKVGDLISLPLSLGTRARQIVTGKRTSFEVMVQTQKGQE